MPFFCLAHQSSFIEIELTLRIYAQEIRSVISVGRQACQTDGEEIGVVSEGLSDPTKIQTRERETDRPAGKAEHKKAEGATAASKAATAADAEFKAARSSNPPRFFAPSVGRRIHRAL